MQISPSDLLILKALAWGPRHGYAITRWIRSASGDGIDLEDRTLYIAIHRLEARKLVKGAWQETPTGRRARTYTLTAAGKTALREAVVEWRDYIAAFERVLDARFAEESP